MLADDEAALLERVAGILEEMQVPYMIGGGVALAVWAIPRTTHDFDIVVDLPEERITEFCSHFPPDKYYIDADAMQNAFRHRDQSSLGMYSFIDMETGIKIDLFPLRPNDSAQQEALARRVTAEVLEGLVAVVYAPDDLLVQKLRWYAASNSERQLQDCLNLVLTDLQRQTPLISWDYVEDWTNRLGAEVYQAWRAVKTLAMKANKLPSEEDLSSGS